ncbi:unnamed protein product, partial [Prorocentrum cordatum]
HPELCSELLRRLAARAPPGGPARTQWRVGAATSPRIARPDCGESCRGDSAFNHRASASAPRQTARVRMPSPPRRVAKTRVQRTQQQRNAKIVDSVNSCSAGAAGRNPRKKPNPENPRARCT